MNRKLAGSRYEALKRLGADLIEDYALSYPLEPDEVAAALGVSVERHSWKLPEVARLCSTTDGYTLPVAGDSGLKFQVHLNDAAAPLRQRFTLAHELAHVWLDHPRSGSALTNDEMEGEANFLASYLLAPDILVSMWLPELTVAGIATTFMMSIEAAGFAHKRVMRTLNRELPWQPHDQRILSAASRRTSGQVLMHSREQGVLV